MIDIDVVDNPVRRKEQWALQDKAYTAMGYSYLAEKKSEKIEVGGWCQKSAKKILPEKAAAASTVSGKPL